MPTIGVALAIPAPHGDFLQAKREEFGDPLARDIPPHVTLLPPTEVDAEDVPAFEEHLAVVAAGAAPFRVVLRGTGTFRPVSPVVFVQVSQGIAGCEQLEQAVRSGPVTRDLDFPYHPHVTVAHHLDDAALDHAFDDLAQVEIAFDATELHLYEHGDDGVWRPGVSFPFGPGAGPAATH
ncbi:2'-5' RNA ligase family protein [Janibacter sp. G56]|uniref:2'-5' RNA ligase family protein n=1 Tax=Janibacter sp. G56 TaxID=3418717 RepID=UPI003CFCCCED